MTTQADIYHDGLKITLHSLELFLCLAAFAAAHGIDDGNALVGVLVGCLISDTVDS